MAEQGHVIAMGFDHRTSDPAITASKVGINKASVGGFACRQHDAAFGKIDKPFSLSDHEALSLVFLRSILKEISLLENLLRNVPPHLLRHMDKLHEPGMDYISRLQSLEAVRQRLLACSFESDCRAGETCQVNHTTRIIKTDRVVVAGSIAQGGYDQFIDQYRRPVPATLWSGEHNASWGFSVLPFSNCHAVILSTMQNASATRFFEHIVSANGRALEEAVSVELILFCENWAVGPYAWGRFGATKQRAILDAFHNFQQLARGQYQGLSKVRRLMEQRRWGVQPIVGLGR